MSENKILVAGQIFGNDEKLKGSCEGVACNFDLSWLFFNPSTLLWSDKIIVTPEMLNIIKKGEYDFIGDGNKKLLGTATNVIFEELDRHGMLEIKKPSEALTKEESDLIYHLLEKDRQTNTNPKIIVPECSGVPGEINIGDNSYCSVKLWALYVSILLSKKWGSNVLFGEGEYTYLMERHFSSNAGQDMLTRDMFFAYEEIFSFLLPSSKIGANILFENDCKGCNTEKKCESNAIEESNNSIKEILEWRSRDELFQLRAFIDKLNTSKNFSGMTKSEIICEFEHEKVLLNKKIHKVFPKYERWSKLITMVSLPIAVAGYSTGSSTITSVGAGVASISKAIEEYVGVLKSKTNWLAFYNKK